MKVRLQKAIADAGVCSRRQAEEFIRLGEVQVNGKIVNELGLQVDPENDRIQVEGKQIPQKAKPAVYALYKPKSVVCTLSDPEGRQTIVDFFPKTKQRLFPIGRLDYDAEGLILVTNDGDLAQSLLHPSKHIWKSYFVKLKGKIQPKEIQRLKKGPIIDGKKRQPVGIKLLHYVNEKSWLEVSLQEGLKHHIKKMFAEIGYPVQKIKRFRIGNLDLGELAPGASRKLSEEDVKTLLLPTKKG